MRLAIASLIPLALACGHEAKQPDGGTDAPTRCGGLPALPVGRYCAAPWFPGQITMAGPNGVGRFALGDLDGDGRLDAIAIGTSNLYTFLGSNRGVWATPVKYNAQPDTDDLAVGDLDGNGSLDVAVVSWPVGGSAGRLDVWLNNGSGVLTPGPSMTTDARSTRVIVADVNADGRPDIIVPTATRIQVFRNQGGAVFAAPSSYTTGTDPYAYPESVAVGDMDNDGRTDILAAYYAGDVYVFGGRANGFVQTAHSTLNLSSPTIAVGDVTGDGKLDIIALGSTMFGPSAHEVELFANPGTGAFSTPAVYFVPDAAGLAIGDLDADGDQDIVVTGGAATVLVNAGGGAFTVERHRNGLGGPVAVADVDGDGKADLAISLIGLYTLLGNGDGTFIEGLPAPAFTADVVADVNHDGFADLVGRDVRRITVALSHGDGRFQGKWAVDGLPFGSAPIVADIDGDNNLDILVTTFYVGTYPGIDPGELIVMRGRGDGTFGQGETYPASAPGTSSLAVGDVNHDCMPDVVLASSGVTIGDGNGNVLEHHDGSADVLVNNGDGTFGAPRPFAGTSQAVRLGDINSDGVAEALVKIGDETILFLADGSGGFTNTANLGANVGTLMDVNHDEHLDLVRSDSVQLGNGDGTFAPPVATDTPYSGSWGDVDGDGNVDGTYFRLFQGHGDGTFTKRDYSTNFGALADFNGDGYLDTIYSDTILLQRCL